MGQIVVGADIPPSVDIGVTAVLVLAESDHLLVN